jgi:hypothetical protein
LSLTFPPIPDEVKDTVEAANIDNKEILELYDEDNPQWHKDEERDLYYWHKHLYIPDGECVNIV